MTEQLQHLKNSYRDHLEDPRWKELRVQIFDRDQHRCRCCGAQAGLQVHHRQYHRKKLTGEWLKPWEYHSYLLITICDSCHHLGHQKFPIPTKEI